ncbi:MAG: efflux RND transporter periplasmic adaptor subunit [Planctomycetes bacterium]|nr:efflux RND transporter periplasmic adaptor subunit [Planctomycetota bacterium]
MTESNAHNPSSPLPKPEDEGGLWPPDDLGFWGKAWWWFDFLILVKLARLRFIAILLVIGVIIVKWDLLTAYYDKWTRPGSARTASADFEFFCPMHPTVVRDNAKEKCPICFMPLSKRKKGDSTEEALPPGIVNRVQLSPYRVVLAGIETWPVAYLSLSKEIATVGFVEFNEAEMKQVAARVKGRLDKLFVDKTGQFVHANEELASLYSPELVVTVQNLLDAAKPTGNPTLLQNAKDRLKLWGISDDQVMKIIDTGKANTHLKIRSPIKGHVLKKYVKEGQYVDEGTPLYDIVDISKVWIQGQVYEDDMIFLPPQSAFHKDGDRPKLPVMAFTRANPNDKFEGNLTFIHPHVDQDTRTVVVRFEIPNPDHKLRPGTSATIKLKVEPKQVELFRRSLADDWLADAAGDGISQAWQAPFRPASFQPLWRHWTRMSTLEQGLLLAIPESAVIDTGNLTIVYREVAAGEYEGVRVELGPRLVGADDKHYFPVLRGLELGDRIVTAGSFLLDAETRLNPAAGSIYFGGGSAGKSAGASSVRPSTPEDLEAKIAAALAKLSEPDRKLADAQKYCPILKGSPLGSMGAPTKLTILGQPIYVCCAGCEKGARVNPQRTLDEVARLKAKAAK